MPSVTIKSNMFSVIVLSVVMLNVIMLSVVAPKSIYLRHNLSLFRALQIRNVLWQRPLGAFIIKSITSVINSVT